MSDRAKSFLARSPRPPQRSRQKPVLNRSSPLARGLIAWYVPVGVSPFLATNYGPGVDGSTLDLVRSPNENTVGYGSLGPYFDFGTTSNQYYYEQISDDKLFAYAAPMTMAGWTRVDETGANQHIIWQGHTDVTNAQQSIYISDTDKPAMMHYTGTFTGVEGTTTVSVGDIVHVCGVWAADDDRRIYVNGVEENSSSTSDAWIPPGEDAVAMGMLRDVTPSGQTGNPIFEVAVWDRALTPGEIWQLYDPATRWDLHWQPKLMVPGFVGPPTGTTVAPDPSFALGFTVDPVIQTGPITVSPNAAFALGFAVDPQVLFGSTTATPAAAFSLGFTQDPVTVLGSVTVTPTQAFALGFTVNPDVQLGSLVLTPTEAFSLGFTIDPAVAAGGIAVTPAAAFALGFKVDPAVIQGSISITPAQAFALGFTVNPNVQLGSIALTVDEAFALGFTVDPAVQTGPILVIPASAFSLGFTVDPTLGFSSMTVTPSEAFALGLTVDPAAIQGSITLTPAEAFALGLTVDPAIVLGAVSVTPPASFSIGFTEDPVVEQSSITVTVNPAFGLGFTADPSVVVETLRFAQCRLRYKTTLNSRLKNFKPRLQ
jgi:hypothetical protein